MKKLLISILLCGIVVPLLATNKNCECGEHSTGITTYTVNGDLCCTSPIAVGTFGMQYTYIQNDGVWELDTSTMISGSDAQRHCCEPTP